MEAPCHARIASLTQQAKDADFRAKAERDARVTLNEKQAKLVQSYNDLNSFHQTARAEYGSMELAFKEETRRRQFAEHLLACEKYTRSQADKNFGELLASMKILAVNFHTLAIDSSTLTENEKKSERRLDYGSIFLEREALRHERNTLLQELKESEKTVLSLRNQLGL